MWLHGALVIRKTFKYVPVDHTVLFYTLLFLFICILCLLATMHVCGVRGWMHEPKSVHKLTFFFGACSLELCRSVLGVAGAEAEVMHPWRASTSSSQSTALAQCRELMRLTPVSQRKCFPVLADEWISMFIRAPHQSHHFFPPSPSVHF